MNNLGQRALSLVIAGSFTLLGSLSASASTTGQYGFTGRQGSCLECHGANQYDGLALDVTGLGEEVACWVVDSELSTAESQVLKRLNLPTMAFNQTVDMVISVTDPGADAPCPVADCCACEGDACAGEEICGNADGFFVDNLFRNQGECINFLNDCDIDDDGAQDAVAGFNIEVVGGGLFGKSTPDDNSVGIRENGGEVIPTEVTHLTPQYFDNGPVTWNLKYTAPAEADYDDGLSFWVGANVANGNGRADELDLNSNFQLTVALGDRLPSFCAVCDDEGTRPNADTGNCPGPLGCSSSGSPADATGFGLAALIFLGLTRRRRA